MKMDATMAAGIEMYKTKLTTATNGLMAAITAQEATKHGRKGADEKNAAEITRKKQEDVPRKKRADEEKEKKVAAGQKRQEEFKARKEAARKHRKLARDSCRLGDEAGA